MIWVLILLLKCFVEYIKLLGKVEIIIIYLCNVKKRGILRFYYDEFLVFFKFIVSV